MEQKGSTLLKVVSIIMIIGGILSAIGSVIVAAGAGFVTAVQGDPSLQAAAAEAGANMGVVTGLVWVAAIFCVVSAVIEIIAGVKGKKNYANPSAAQNLMIWGIVCAVVSVIGNILFATSGAGVQVISIVLGLVLPVLYIIGALQLKNQG